MRRSGLTGLVFGGANTAALGAVRAAVASEALPGTPHGEHQFPFVTVSRQAGAGGRSFAEKLAERLTKLDPAKGNEPAWAAWDHQLMDKVAAEHGIDAAVVEAIELARRPWFADLLSGLNSRPDPTHPDEFAVYKRLAATIRGLAKIGRCILVGRASVFITRGLPGGVHVRLVAPHDHRVRHMAAQHQITESETAALVDKLDRARQQFFRHHWPSANLDPETFTLTLNTAGWDEDTLAECVVPFVKARSDRLVPA